MANKWQGLGQGQVLVGSLEGEKLSGRREKAGCVSAWRGNCTLEDRALPFEKAPLGFLRGAWGVCVFIPPSLCAQEKVIAERRL